MRMTPREWECATCGSRFATDATGELVHYALTPTVCLGCQRLWLILEASARKRALIRAAVTEPATPLTLAAIDARLRRGRVLKMHDARKAAANDRDDDEE
jgi:hypothetical protein